MFGDILTRHEVVELTVGFLPFVMQRGVGHHNFVPTFVDDYPLFLRFIDEAYARSWAAGGVFGRYDVTTPAPWR